MTARRGQIVGIPFPHADLQTRKRRPVVVLTEPDRYGDFIAVAVTSVPTAVLAVPITNDDLSDGLLPKQSWVRCDKMFTLSQPPRLVAALFRDIWRGRGLAWRLAVLGTAPCGRGRRPGKWAGRFRLRRQR